MFGPLRGKGKLGERWNATGRLGRVWRECRFTCRGPGCENRGTEDHCSRGWVGHEELRDRQRVVLVFI